MREIESKSSCEGNIYSVSPLQLVTAYRFDVIIKYMYAKSIKDNLKTLYYKNIYKEHLRLWNNFKEYDNVNKNTFEDFDNTFKTMINDMSVNGFNENKSNIPVISSRWIVN